MHWTALDCTGEWGRGKGEGGKGERGRGGKGPRTFHAPAMLCHAMPCHAATGLPSPTYVGRDSKSDEVGYLGVYGMVLVRYLV